DRNIIASVGHSDAGFAQVMEHIEYGLNKITHMHNACSPHHHRKPGIVTAGFYSDDLFAEIIADGVHIHPDVLKTIFKIKGAERIILITDSLEAKGLEDGEYIVGGLAMIKKGNELRIENGKLAGSIMPMNLCAKYMFDNTDADIMDIVSMTSVNAAKLLKIDKSVSRIKEGYTADLVVLDEDFNVLSTFCRGEKIC
ncbi:MAG: amidohydrolase family protein, partial [Clostridia bacterium]|nr:amidohydrolase family protein [Clostridia bacterium]